MWTEWHQMHWYTQSPDLSIFQNSFFSETGHCASSFSRCSPESSCSVRHRSTQAPISSWNSMLTSMDVCWLKHQDMRLLPYLGVKPVFSHWSSPPVKMPDSKNCCPSYFQQNFYVCDLVSAGLWNLNLAWCRLLLHRIWGQTFWGFNVRQLLD